MKIKQTQSKDLVQYMAEEKAKDKRAVRNRRIFWQIVIFMIAFLINVLITYREVFILDQSELFPDSDIRLATNLCRGIGFIVLGNLYDNVSRPKRLTFMILLSLSLCTALVILVEKFNIFIGCCTFNFRGFT